MPEDPAPRFIAPDEDGPPKEVPLGGAMPYDAIVGPFNPMALPVALDFDPPKRSGRAVFDVTYEGAPGLRARRHPRGHVRHHPHCGQRDRGLDRPDRALALRYLRPTLTNEEAVFEGWVTEVTDSRIFSKGRIVQGGIVTVEADGEFAIFNQDGVHRMALEPPPVLRRRRMVRRAPAGPADGGVAGRTVARQSLEPSRDPADYAFMHRLRTRFAETDAMGVIHHAAYLPYLEEARVEYLRSIGHPYDAVRGRRGRGRAGSSPCSRSSVRYRQPLRFDDEVDVSLRIGAVTRRHVPDRLPRVGRRRGAGDRGDRARLCRRPGRPARLPGVGPGSSPRRRRSPATRRRGGDAELRARRRAARTCSPSPASPRAGRRRVRRPCPPA